MLFAAVAAEDGGLLGSGWFCAHPLVPAGRLAANLNIDGINIRSRSRAVGWKRLPAACCGGWLTDCVELW